MNIIVKSSLHRVLVAGGLCALALEAQAAQDQSGWYVGAGIGQSKISDSDSLGAALDAQAAAQGVASSSTYDDRDTAYKLYGGYQFNSNWGIEGGYNRLGRFSANSSIAGGSGSGT